MQNFQELNLNKNLNASLVKMKFDTPTPIQITTDQVTKKEFRDYTKCTLISKIQFQG